MNTSTDSRKTDHQLEEERRTISSPPMTETPVVVILTPELNDPMFAEFWKFSFDQLASKFKEFGVRAIAAPWMTTPLSSDTSQSFIYIANLAWGYHYYPDRWNSWLRNWPKEFKLFNSPSLLLWNTRKTYLQDLKNAGIPIIPTLHVEHIDEKILIDAAANFNTSDLMVKPQISACSFNTIRVLVGSNDFACAPKSLSTSDAVAELIRLNAIDSMMMIQPFMSSVVQEGEMSVFVFNGKVSHAVKSNTQLDDYRVQFEHGGVTTALKEISTEMLELVHAAIAACPEIPVYARIDIIRNLTTGHLCIIEIELIEPNLFLEHALDGGTAFVRAILQACGHNSHSEDNSK
ncbi:unnamed protein product [Adineta steineri]|uniref:ATP-grasp domain-containing protein n=2 Tax=Adineta steineri TaxID=433720 RepID=A0A813WG37_9BILA|nr:unnamed protein product [Adineta steineri]